jgi:hypothetical protein
VGCDGGDAVDHDKTFNCTNSDSDIGDAGVHDETSKMLLDMYLQEIAWS